MAEDRQDMDALSEGQQFENMVLAAMHATLSSAAIKALTARMPDSGIAGVEIERATLPTILFAKEILDNWPARDAAEGTVIGGTNFCGHGMMAALCPKCAPPKPAPDAMRSLIALVLPIMEAAAAGKSVQLAATDVARELRAYSSAPAPPASIHDAHDDIARGISRGEGEAVPLHSTNHHNALKCPYCNPQGLSFAPPCAGAAEPAVLDAFGWLLDAIKSEGVTPTPLLKRRFEQAEKALLLAVAAPPVRGDREAIARDLRNYANWTILTDETRELIEKAARELSLPVQPGADERLIPAGIYFDVDGSNFYSLERGCGCGQAFYSEWRSLAREFPQSKEAALALMPPWLDMKSAPRNATEIVLRIPSKGYPDHYAQIGHWAEMDGSEQPPAKGWFRNTGYGFVGLPEPTGWRWPLMTAPSSRQTPHSSSEGGR